MKRAGSFILVLALAACSGNFGSGGGGGGYNPPQAPQQQQQPANPTPASNDASPAAAPTGDSATYPFSQAPTGMQCPTVAGFSCLLKFNAPAPTPSPTATPKGTRQAKGAAKTKPTATPSPTPSPSPSATPSPSAAPSGAANPKTGDSAAPSPSPASANVTFTLAALPKDAPTMVSPDPKALSTTALLTLRMKADAVVLLDGTAIAEFTLPKDQIGGRSYAIGLFQETTKKKRHDDRFVGSFSNSTIDGTTLRFVFTPPKLQIKKDEVWLFVLYSAESPETSPAPSASGSAAPASPTGSPSPSPAPTGE